MDDESIISGDLMDLEITLEDGTVISFKNGDVVGETQIPESSKEEMKKFLAGHMPYKITARIMLYWDMWWMFPPGSEIPGLHDN